MANVNKGIFPPGGPTPVFNQVEILLTLSPMRPPAEAGFDDLKGPKERLVMKNVIDSKSGHVQPTVFFRSEPYVDQATGRKTMLLGLADDSGVAMSQLLGGELSVHVRPMDTPSSARMGFPSVDFDAIHLPPRIPIPATPSVGKIQALSPDSDFPAKVTIPVYYSFLLRPEGGKGEHAESLAVQAKEPHIMEAVVNSIPPDPVTPIRASEWNLVDSAGILRLWIKVEAFRFLGLGGWNQKEPVSYHG